MPSEIRLGPGSWTSGAAAVQENVLLGKLRGLIPGRGAPFAPGKGHAF